MANKSKYHERVGRKIQEIREKCGVTVTDLAVKSGLSENAIKSIENGRRDIKVSELFEISKALDVRISAFLNPCDSKFYKRIWITRLWISLYLKFSMCSICPVYRKFRYRIVIKSKESQHFTVWRPPKCGIS